MELPTRIYSTIWYVVYPWVDRYRRADLLLQSNEDGAEPINPPKARVLSDGLLAIGAGADTTASVLSNTFWLLLKHPQYYKRLQEEVDKFYPPGEDSLDSKYHTQMPFLDAVMYVFITRRTLSDVSTDQFSCRNETLRLYPVVPSGSQRAPIPGQGDRVIGP